MNGLKIVIDENNSIVAFGDEIGIPQILQVAERLGVKVSAIVTDPDRMASVEANFNIPSGCIRLFHHAKSSRETFVANLDQYVPTLGIINSYSRILWPELLALFSNGVVNIHNGKLPEYRGGNPIQWSIINLETESAATLHYAIEGIDAGPVIDSIPVGIGLTDTAVELRNNLVKADHELLYRWIKKLVAGKVAATDQNEALVTDYPRRVPEDGRIDWSLRDEQINALIRALVKPWPGAFYEDRHGEKVVIDYVIGPEKLREVRREMGR